jgi:hypothetical protein
VREREAMSKVLDRVQPKSVMSRWCQSKTDQDQNPTAYQTDTVEKRISFRLPPGVESATVGYGWPMVGTWPVGGRQGICPPLLRNR